MSAYHFSVDLMYSTSVYVMRMAFWLGLEMPVTGTSTGSSGPTMKTSTFKAERLRLSDYGGVIANHFVHIYRYPTLESIRKIDFPD